MILAGALLFLAGQDAEAGRGTKPPAYPIRPLAPLSPPPSWVHDGDYPESASTRRISGLVKFRLDVDGKGNPVACHILNSSGYWVLDERSCSLLLVRAKFRPARDANGVGVTASFTSVWWWGLGGADRQEWTRLTRQITEPLPATVTVKKLPTSYKTPALVRVRFDKTGKPSGCKLELTSGNAAIDQVACRRAQADATLPEPASSSYAQPDVRMYLVAFGAGASD
jgi:TonB family protein